MNTVLRFIMRPLQLILTLITGPLSFIGSLLMIILYISFKKLRSFSIVIGLSIGQMIFDLQWILSYPASENMIPETVCRISTSIVIYASTLMWMYTLALSVIIFSSYRRMKITQASTTKIHIVINLTALVYFCTFHVVEATYGFKNEENCFEINDTMIYFMNIPMICANIFNVVIAGIVYHYGVNKKIVYHLLITLIYTFSFVPLLGYWLIL